MTHSSLDGAAGTTASKSPTGLRASDFTLLTLDDYKRKDPASLRGRHERRFGHPLPAATMR